MFKKLMVAVICFAASTGHAFSVDLNKSHGIVGALATGGTLLLVYAGPYVYKRGRAYYNSLGTSPFTVKGLIKASACGVAGIVCSRAYSRYVDKPRNRTSVKSDPPKDPPAGDPLLSEQKDPPMSAAGDFYLSDDDDHPKPPAGDHQKPHK